MLWGLLSREGVTNMRWAEWSFTTAGVWTSEANTDGRPSRMFSWSWTDTSKSHACLWSTSLHTEISSIPVKSYTQLQKLINIQNQTQHTVQHYRAIWNQYWALALLQGMWCHIVWQEDCSSKTLVPVNQTTECHTQEEHNLEQPA